MKLKIKDFKVSPFTGDEGERVEYFWYRAVRESDGVTIRFGSMDGTHEAGDEVDLDIEKYERTDKNGKTVIAYKENLAD